MAQKKSNGLDKKLYSAKPVASAPAPGPQPVPATGPRTKQQIEQEFFTCATQLGQLEFQVELWNTDITAIKSKMLILNREAGILNAIAAVEAAKASEQAPPPAPQAANPKVSQING